MRALWIATFVFVVVKAAVAPHKHSMYPSYAQTTREWVSSGPFASIHTVQHLPYFSDLVAPFALLPDRIGASGWALVVFAVYAAGLRAFLAIHPPALPTGGAGTQLALLCGLLVGGGSLANHQSNVLIAGCWLWAAVAVHRGRWWWAAALFAIPGFKIYTLAPALVFAALYPRQLGGRLAAAVAATFAVPYLLHPAAAVNYRFEALAGYLTSGDHYRIFQFHTLYEAWRTYVGPIEARRLLPAQALAGLAVLPALWRMRRAGRSEPDVQRTGLFLACVWCVSFGPSIEAPTYLLAAPAFGWWLGRSAMGPHSSRLAAVLVASVISLAGSPLYSLEPAIRRTLTQYQVPFLAISAFYLGQIAVTLWSASRSAPNLQSKRDTDSEWPAESSTRKRAA